MPNTHAITCASWKYTGCEEVVAVCTIPNCPEDGDHYDRDRRCDHCERAEAGADWDE